jgi:hypothetical protein
MVVGVRDGIGRTDKAAGKTSDAVLGMFHHTEAFFCIKFEYLSGADINTELAATA